MSTRRGCEWNDLLRRFPALRQSAIEATLERTLVRSHPIESLTSLSHKPALTRWISSLLDAARCGTVLHADLINAKRHEIDAQAMEPRAQ